MRRLFFCLNPTVHWTHAFADPDALVFARFSFWLPPEHLAKVETVYATRVMPFLERHGLEPSDSRGRDTRPCVFS